MLRIACCVTSDEWRTPHASRLTLHASRLWVYTARHAKPFTTAHDPSPNLRGSPAPRAGAASLRQMPVMFWMLVILLVTAILVGVGSIAYYLSLGRGASCSHRLGESMG